MLPLKRYDSEEQQGKINNHDTGSELEVLEE